MINFTNFFIALGDPNQAVFFGTMGVVSALVFANLGAAYGTAKSGVGIVSVAVLKPDLLFRSIIPVVMAGVLGMYGMIIAILIRGASKCFVIRFTDRESSLICAQNSIKV